MERKHFGRYEVLEEIGDGAMGRVYRCFDPLVRRIVAIKTVKSEYLTKETAEEYLERFRREAQSAGGLSHPAIVGIFDVGEDYLVMELLEGTTLQELLRERSRLEVQEALRILSPVAEALDFAHKAGIVHRDIKPANIMVLRDGRPKLMDFGVAHLESSVMTAAGELLGSPSYMAPEQMLTGQVDYRGDLFSFAVVAYETLTGQQPFQGATITGIIYHVVNDPPPPPCSWNVGLPAVYDEVFARALSKVPAERHASASAIVAALSMGVEAGPAFAVDVPRVPASTPPATVERHPLGALLTPKGAVETHSLSAPTTPPKPLDDTHGVVQTHAIPVQPAAPHLVATEPINVVLPSPAGPSSGARPLLAVAGLLAAMLLGWVFWHGPAPAPDLPSPSPRPLAADPLRVESQPEGATVWLDGTEAGVTPLDLRGLAPGSHSVRVSIEGYAPAELGLEIQAGVTLPPLRFLMEAVSARVAILSEPSEASVRIDGAAAGTTPIPRVFLTPGRHEVRVDRKGFQPSLQHIDVEAGQELELTARLDRVVVGKPPTPEPTPPPTPEPKRLAEGDLVPVDDTVTKPRRISGNTASYPDRARKQGMLGSVTVEMIVDEKGIPTNLRVIKSAGQVLDEAVLDAMRGWRFEPARKQGVKVKVLFQATQTFARSG